MSDPGPVRVFRPVPWSEQPQWGAAIRAAMSPTVLSLAMLLQFWAAQDTRPRFAALTLVLAALAPAPAGWEWWRGTRERLVLTDDTVELHRGRRRRPVARVLRDDALWASRFALYRPEADSDHLALALSDGREGIQLRHPGWQPRHTELLTIMGVPAPRVKGSIAVRRHPEAFAWSVRHPVTSALLTVAALAAVLVLAVTLS